MTVEKRRQKLIGIYRFLFLLFSGEGPFSLRRGLEPFSVFSL